MNALTLAYPLLQSLTPTENNPRFAFFVSDRGLGRSRRQVGLAQRGSN